MNIDIVTKEDLRDLKEEILIEIRLLHTAVKTPVENNWLRSADVRKMLAVSPGTLQNLRIQGKIRFTKLGGSFFYKLGDIEMALAQNSIKSEKFS